MYVERPEFVETLAGFVRSRPAQPVDAFLAQAEAAISHDASAVLADVGAPTLIIFGARDLICSTRFAEPLKNGIAGSELVVFDHLSHAGLHEDPETFNRATLDFLPGGARESLGPVAAVGGHVRRRVLPGACVTPGKTAATLTQSARATPRGGR
jgi:hypothetical protein